MATYKDKEEMWAQVESSLEGRGWSVDHPEEPKADIYVASRAGKHRYFWAKYSKHHDETDKYFFSLEMTWLDGFRDDQGGVLFMMPGVDYALIPFAEALNILDSATRTKGNEVRLDIRATGNALLLLPGGAGEWHDVTRYKLDLSSL